MNAPATSDSSRGYDVVRKATRISSSTVRKIAVRAQSQPQRSRRGVSEASSEESQRSLRGILRGVSEAVESGADAGRERGAVEAVEAEGLGRCTEGRPALDAVDGHRPLQLPAESIAER